jgi:tryptophan-rich sensory protein
MIHKLDSAELIPPMWIFNLLWLVWSYLSGSAAGAVICNVSIGRTSGREEIQAYKGGLFFISLLFLNLIWYPILFINESLFLSLVVLLTSVICSILCSAAWQKVNRMPGLIMAAHTIWLVYVFIVNFSVFIHN